MEWTEFVAWIEFNNWLDVALAIYVLSFGVQLFYYCFFFLRLAFFKTKKWHGEALPVSVVICAKNESKNLLAFLPFYLHQQHPVFEIIVVNDNSVDDTAAILKRFQLQHQQLKVVNVPDTNHFYGNKKFALTLGIKAAQYNNVLLTDADCKPATNQWITLMSQYELGKEIVLGIGNYEQKKGLLNKIIRFETFYTAAQYLSFALAKIPYMGVGRNLGYQKQLFFKNKGFSSHQHILSGDDDLLVNEVANKTNTQIVVDKKAHTISRPKTTYSGWIKQKRRHLLAGHHYQVKHQLMLGILQVSQFVFITFFVVLLVKVKLPYVVLGLFMLRYSIQILTFNFLANKIGGKGLIFLTPFYEIILMLLNPILVISNFLNKKTKWN